MLTILGEFAKQVIFSIGILIIVALLIDLISRAFHALMGRTGRKIILTTAVIGTPIHELGHVLMCIIFGHKIEDMQLLQFHDPKGVLGYVNHSYNKKNPYHVVGNFFIAIGPIVLGGAIMIGLLFAMVPDVARGVLSAADGMSGGLTDSGGSTFIGIGSGIGDIFITLFAGKNFANWLWWLYMVLMIFIAMHMRLSAQDIKSGWVGMLFFVAILFVVDLIVGTISKGALVSMSGGIIVLGSYILSILTISLILSTFQLLFSLIYAGIRFIGLKVRK